MVAPYIAVVADDLTGAGDTAVQFVRVGWQTQLSVGRAERALSDPGVARAEVLAVTTHTRALSDIDATAVVQQDVAALRAAGVRRLYKKVDSTLRGPFRAEIEAARAAWRSDAIAVVCPAFPEMGRTLQDGILYVKGVPVAQTSAGTDPVTPVTESHVPTLLGAAHVVPGDGETAAALACRIEQAGTTVVVDARNVEDMELLARAISLMGERALPVGSGGLAVPMARLWAQDDRDGPVVVVVTSQHSEARRQAQALVEWGARSWTPSLADMADARAWETWCADVLAQARDNATHATWLLLAPEGTRAGVDSDAVAQRLGELAATLVKQCAAVGVVATGGDGASAVLDALDAVGIALVDEVTGGMPLGTLTGGPKAGLPVVTKAGGFGAREVLIKAAVAVRERRFTV